MNYKSLKIIVKQEESLACYTKRPLVYQPPGGKNKPHGTTRDPSGIAPFSRWYYKKVIISWTSPSQG
jgi:hypothetical protein